MTKRAMVATAGAVFALAPVVVCAKKIFWPTLPSNRLHLPPLLHLRLHPSPL